MGRIEQVCAYRCRVPCPRCQRSALVIAGATATRDDGTRYELNAAEARLAVVQHVDIDVLLACELVELGRQQTLWDVPEDPLASLEVCRNCGAHVNTLFPEVQKHLADAFEAGLAGDRTAIFAIFSRDREPPAR